MCDGKMVKDTYMKNEELKTVLKEIDEKYQPRGFLLTAEGHPCVTYNTKRSNFLFQLSYQLWYFFQFKYREGAEKNT